MHRTVHVKTKQIMADMKNSRIDGMQYSILNNQCNESPVYEWISWHSPQAYSFDNSRVPALNVHMPVQKTGNDAKFHLTIPKK